MKAKPVTYKGINFRSTLEVKHYINMTENFGWEVEYEPQIEGLYGWLPDFLIKGCERDILVEVKPIRSFKEWENHPDSEKVEGSGVFDFYENKPIYDLLILGATGFLKPDKYFSVFNKKTVIGFYFDMGVEKLFEDEKKINPGISHINIFEPAELTYCFENKRFGFSVCQGQWRDRIMILVMILFYTMNVNILINLSSTNLVVKVLSIFLTINGIKYIQNINGNQLNENNYLRSARYR